VAAINGQVILFPDTTTNFNHPELGIAAVEVIEKLGYQVILPEMKCCGRPMLSNGMIDAAKENISFNIDQIYPYIESGAKLVGIEPSCVLGFLGDFGDLMDDPRKTDVIAENTMLVEEFFLHALENDSAITFQNAPKNQTAVLHGHCHQKALVGTSAAMQVLGHIPGLNASEVESGCCGMAGSFGYLKDHYEISMQIGEETLFPKLRNEDEDTLVITEGVSCREQIEQGTGRKSKHLVQVLAEYL
jgi:Fe-S oxidoreductase